MIVHNSIKIIVCISLFIFLIGQKVQGQPEKPFSLNDIQAELNSISRIIKSTEEINKVLITEVRKRGVNFTLTFEKTKFLKKAGASDLLIKVICENLPKKIEEQIILYKKFTDNYAGTLEQKRKALEAAKEICKKI